MNNTHLRRTLFLVEIRNSQGLEVGFQGSGVIGRGAWINCDGSKCEIDVLSRRSGSGWREWECVAGVGVGDGSGSGWREWEWVWMAGMGVGGGSGSGWREWKWLEGVGVGGGVGVCGRSESGLIKVV